MKAHSTVPCAFDQTDAGAERKVRRTARLLIEGREGRQFEGGESKQNEERETIVSCVE